MSRLIKRGYIFLCDLGRSEGSKQGGFRPVLVVQNNYITKSSTEVLVAPITGKIKKPFYFCHVYLGQRFGLDVPSMVLCEQITMVEKDKLQHYLGTVDDPKTMGIIDNAVQRAFGIKKSKSKLSSDIRCLCQAHREEYFLTNKYIVRRLDPLQSAKEKCDKCNRLGYDYILINKDNAIRRRGEYYGR